MAGAPPYLDALLALQQSDGGWPAAPDGPTLTEPTAWVTAALGPFTAHEPALRAGADWLERTRLGDGGWAAEPSLGRGDAATAPALLALARTTKPAPAMQHGSDWLLRHQAPANTWLQRVARRVLDIPDPSGVDDALRGWSWTPGTMTWVEPTATAMLALRAARGARDPQVMAACAQGTALLLDRACPAGGWNYGNARVLGVPLPGYPDTTAWALLALHPRREQTAVRRSLDWLQPAARDTGSGLALALAALVAQRYGIPDDDLRLDARRAFDRTGFCGDVRALALALAAETRQADALFG